jgi:hypothetical protein
LTGRFDLVPERRTELWEKDTARSICSTGVTPDTEATIFVLTLISAMTN